MRNLPATARTTTQAHKPETQTLNAKHLELVVIRVRGHPFLAHRIRLQGEAQHTSLQQVLMTRNYGTELKGQPKTLKKPSTVRFSWLEVTLQFSRRQPENRDLQTTWEFPKVRDTLFWGPYNKGPTIR